MARTAWLDTGLVSKPLATTYNNYLLQHETGLNDNETGTAAAIDAYISSSEFDIGDGDNFGFVWRMLPDLSFEGSVSDPVGNLPQVTLTLYPMLNSGSGASTPGVTTVKKVAAYNVTEEFTGIVYTRIRGRQFIFKIESNQVGTAWQLGATRLDVRPDGRR
jgi:hypothetical protein